MKKMGRLTVTNGVPKLEGTAIGVYHATDTFKFARTAFEALGLTEGDEVSVEGILDNIDDEPVLLMLHVSRAGGSLGGSIPLNWIDVTCQQCGFVNQGLPYIDFKNPPTCKNPNRPPHVLKVF